MESLIFLVVVVIIIISNILNVRKKVKSQAPEEKTEQGGLKTTLKDLIADIRSEMEGSSGQGDKQARQNESSSAWDELMGRQKKPEVRAEPKPDETRRREATTRMDTKEPPRMATKEPSLLEQGGDSLLEELEKRGDTPEERMARAESKAREQKGEKKSLEKGPAYSRDIPAPPTGRRRRSRPVYSVAELRKAIIWSEILDLPIALRPPGRQR